DWCFQERAESDPVPAFQIRGRVMVGKVPGDVSLKTLEEIALPRREVRGKNCVSWTRNAIEVLQGIGVVEKFEIEMLMDDALGFADECLRNQEIKMLNYTKRAM
ncbi:hypothetical protein P175DRAFT_0439594, partial [Aspergillus ochraceoroseus IBT 24754]